MGKYYGKVGYVIPTKVVDGVYANVEPIVRPYYGDTIEETVRFAEDSKQLNDQLRIRVKISILADKFAYDHFSKIKFCEYMGVLWKVTDVAPGRPRIVLTLGGEYNGEQA